MRQGASRRGGAIALLLALAVAAVAVVAARGGPPPQAPPQGQAPPSSQAPPTEPQRPTFRVEANYVRVDVFVTRDGVPVTDLTADDFEVREDKVPQRIDAFEHVQVRGHTPVGTAREPQTVAEAREMARNPRARVFVVFLDTYHTTLAGSHRMQRALVALLDRLLGPDDLFAVMTPEMSAADITFARRTEGLEQMLAKYWTWGRRDQRTSRDEVELQYEQCYPNIDDTAGVAKEMIARRREKMTLDALTDLAIYLRGVREERKAVLAVSDGWLLYRESAALADQGSSGRRVMPRPGVGPTGGLTTDVEGARTGSPGMDCERDKVQLAMLDDFTEFQQLMDLANRGNVSFYPIDSRGLPVFDTPIEEGVPVTVDHKMLKTRIDSLSTLAVNTDGIAVVNSNDIESGLKRMVDDLTSYYLLGYYSTNPKLDGRFRSISVRVNRPGVEVRSRRGYLAAKASEVSSSAGATATGATPAGGPNTVQAAIAALPPDRAQVRLRVVAGWMGGAPAGNHDAHVWTIGELDAAALRLPDWNAGGEIELRLVDPRGETLASSTANLAAGARTFMSDFGEAAVPAGEYTIRVRLKPSAGGLPLADVARLVVPAPISGPGTPRVFRRGPATGPVYGATADLRFRRSERLRLEWSIAPPVASRAAQLVDRNGKTMALPVTVTERADPSGGLTWIVAELALAPLAEGEYAIRLHGEAAGAPFETVTAFRLVAQ